MSAAQIKASDKQAICKKLVSILKKRYKTRAPKSERSVIETLLYAVCLENASVRQAENAFVRLDEEFHDLNEVRVSSITELEAVFRDMGHPEWRALAVRSVLHYVFEKHFAFDFESLRRKTLESANKQLKSIPHLSPFVRNYTLQKILGTHMVPVDDAMSATAIWLGLAEPGASPEQVSDALKPAIRKADAPLFCHLLRQMAMDPKLKKTFDAVERNAPDDGYDAMSAPARLPELFKEADSRTKKAAARKKAAKKSTKKKTPTKRAAAKGRSGGRSRSKTTTKKKTRKKRASAKK